MRKVVAYIETKDVAVKVYFDSRCEVNPYKCYLRMKAGEHFKLTNEFCLMESVIVWLSGFSRGELTDINDNVIHFPKVYEGIFD